MIVEPDCGDVQESDARLLRIKNSPLSLDQANCLHVPDTAETGSGRKPQMFSQIKVADTLVFLKFALLLEANLADLRHRLLFPASDRKNARKAIVSL